MSYCTFQESCACDPCVAERLERDQRRAPRTCVPSSARADQPAPARATGECLGDRCLNEDPNHTAEECYG